MWDGKNWSVGDQFWITCRDIFEDDSDFWGTQAGEGTTFDRVSTSPPDEASGIIGREQSAQR
jgi:hypothetical protein